MFSKKMQFLISELNFILGRPAYRRTNCGSVCLGTLFYPAFSQTNIATNFTGAQWLSGRVLDSRPRGRWFEPHQRHCGMPLSKNINPSLVLVQPRKTRPFLTERLLMGRKESLRQTNKATVVPTKSDSDVIFCLQLLSKILTFTLRLS